MRVGKVSLLTPRQSLPRFLGNLARCYGEMTIRIGSQELKIDHLRYWLVPVMNRLSGCDKKSIFRILLFLAVFCLHLLVLVLKSGQARPQVLFKMHHTRRTNIRNSVDIDL